MPELNLKVTPVFGDSRYSYALIHDFLEARIRDEIKVSDWKKNRAHRRFAFSSVFSFFPRWMINYCLSCVIGFLT